VGEGRVRGIKRRADIGFIKSLITAIQPEWKNCVNTRKQMDFHARIHQREYGDT
jgi:hypothetical protein